MRAAETDAHGQQMRLLFLVAGVVFLLKASPSLAHAGGDPIVMVVSKSSPLTDISKGQLRTLYLENKVTIGGKQYRPLRLNDKDKTRDRFDKTILGMSAAESSRYWADRKVKGQGLGPKEVSSELKVQVTAYKASNAIGYVRLSEAKQDKMKILKVDGKAPTAAGYLLR